MSISTLSHSFLTTCKLTIQFIRRLYFGAQWCGPCGAFAPKLASYAKDRPQLPVIYCGLDETERQWNKNILGKEAFLAVPFEEDEVVKKLGEQVGVSAIPALAIVDGSSGTVITKKGVDALRAFMENKKKDSAKSEDPLGSWQAGAKDALSALTPDQAPLTQRQQIMMLLQSLAVVIVLWPLVLLNLFWSKVATPILEKLGVLDTVEDWISRTWTGFKKMTGTEDTPIVLYLIAIPLWVAGEVWKWVVGPLLGLVGLRAPIDKWAAELLAKAKNIEGTDGEKKE